MSIIIGILVTIDVIAALLLIGIILIQQTKSGGGLGSIGGGVTEAVFGATAGNVLTRGTVILASIFLCVTLLLAVLSGHMQQSKSVIEDMPSTLPGALPGKGTAPLAVPTPKVSVQSAVKVETPAPAVETPAAPAAKAVEVPAPAPAPAPKAQP